MTEVFRRTYLAAVVAVIVGILLSLVSFRFLRSSAERVVALRTEESADRILNGFLDEMDSNAALLVPVRQLYVSVPHIEPYDFQRIVNAVTAGRPDMRALIWLIPRSPAAAEGLKSSLFGRRMAVGSMSANGTDYYYYKDYYLGVDGASGPQVYFDVSALRWFEASLKQAASKGLAVDTETVRLVEAEEPPGYSVILPIASATGTKDSAAPPGFLVGNFRVAFNDSAVEHLSSVQIDELRDGDAPMRIHYWNARADKVPKGDVPVIEKSVRHAATGLTFRVSARPSRGLLTDHRTSTPWLVLAFGLFITALGSVHLYFRGRREIEINYLLAELKRANEFLKEEIEGREKAEGERIELEKKIFQIQKLDALGRLSGGIAHDLNNYLGAITGFSELSKLKWGDNTELGERMDMIMGVCQRASGLIRQLLAYSRRAPSKPVRSDLREVVVRMTGMIRHLIREDIRLDLSGVTPVPPVMIDPGQFEQVVVNLIVNARDAMQGEGSVSILLDRIDADGSGKAGDASIPPGSYVRFRVRDTGMGIPEEIKNRIFEPFFTTKDAGGNGTGLGLSTVYGIVKQAGGFIRVDSAPGKGATFEMLFPAVEGKDEERVPGGKAAEDPMQQRGAGTILFAEDNKDLRRSTASILSELGYRVVSAGGGEEAEMRFEELGGEVDLLLTDVVMPGISGKELAERLLRKRPGLRVLFVSGYTGNILREGLGASSRVELLAKPFTATELGKKVRRLLDEPAAASPPV